MPVSPNVVLPGTPGLAAALRQGTRDLHARAERSGVVREILAGRGTRHGFALLLRNLLPVYQAIEAALERGRGTAPLAGFARPAMYRAACIQADLATLGGADWHARVRHLEAGRRYAARIGVAAGGDGARLIAHAYVRYLGDLSGGQAMAALLARTLGAPAAALGFAHFPEIADPAAFKADFRAALDAAGSRLADPGEIVAEAALAFRLNIELSEAVQAAVAGSP